MLEHGICVHRGLTHRVFFFSWGLCRDFGPKGYVTENALNRQVTASSCGALGTDREPPWQGWKAFVVLDASRSFFQGR